MSYVPTGSSGGLSIDWSALMGRIELETRMVLTDRGVEGQGRSRRFNGRGVLVETTPWTTATILTMGEPDPVPWWAFWRAPQPPKWPACVLAQLRADSFRNG